MDDLPLFGEPPAPTTTNPPSPLTTAAADWQIDLIRKTLDARGITAIEDRQSLVVRLANRTVGSLRELTSEEALQVLNALGKDAPKTDTRSLWDDRDDSTWIDRM